MRHANVYGVDMPTRREFVAAGKSEEEIRAELGADGLLYQSIEDLIDVGRSLNPAIREFDASCFTGAALRALRPTLPLFSCFHGGRARWRQPGKGVFRLHATRHHAAWITCMPALLPMCPLRHAHGSSRDLEEKAVAKTRSAQRAGEC